MSPTGQGGELLAEGRVLDHQMASRAHGREEPRQEGYEEAEHRAGEHHGPGENRQQIRSGWTCGERQDVMASNGVIHVIDTVLMPK